MTHEERLQLAIEFNKEWVASKKAGKIATKDKIRLGELNHDEINELAAIYPAWEVGVAYKVDDLINYQGALYQVLQAHTSQADWLPPDVPALYVAKVPLGVIPDFVQPTGSHDAYKIGDQVVFEGKVWESLIDANVWSPTAYPQGWKLVE